MTVGGAVREGFSKEASEAYCRAADAPWIGQGCLMAIGSFRPARQ